MSYKTEFLEFAMDQGVLRFGEFTLKSGRVSPYFFNAGSFNTGAGLFKLGRFYAQAIVEAAMPFDVLFGPAYKGIPLVVATALALAAEHQRDMPFAFNRKQTKAYGEGGKLVGAPLAGRVLVVDDVITAGTAVREAAQIIREAQAEPVGVVISLDRQERGQSNRSAIQEVELDIGLTVISIATLQDVLAVLTERPDMAEQLRAMQAYQQKYGV